MRTKKANCRSQRQTGAGSKGLLTLMLRMWIYPKGIREYLKE